MRFVKVLVVLGVAPAALALSAVVERIDARADCLPFTAVAGGSSNTYAVRSDRTLWRYGSETPQAGAEPVAIDRVTQVSAGGQVLALRDNIVWSGGQLSLPVTGAPTSVDVASGIDHSLVVSTTGHVWAWGEGYRGRLGDGTQNDHSSPIEVPNLSGIVDVAAGSEHSLAVRANGTVVAWGENLFGQLGDGSHNNIRTSPVNVLRVTGAVKVAANQNESLALKGDGTVWQWGSEPMNVAPDGPRQVSGLSGIVAVAGGPNALHWVALKNDGSVWTWGYNYSGQIGDGTTNYRSTPYRVLGLPAVKAIGAGNTYSLAVDQSGQVWGWGGNSNGQLGDGTTAERRTPVRAQNLVQCFVPDAESTPAPVPTVSAAPTPTVSPPAAGEEAPEAECRFVRAQGEIAYGGYAIAGNETPPAATTIRCTVTTGAVYGERTATAPGPVAVVNGTVSAPPAPVTICTYAEAVYAGNRVVSTSFCRES